MFKKISWFFILILFVLSTSMLYGKNNDKSYNPFLAGTLSWYSAGLGQVYTSQYLKGAVFFVIDNSLLLLFVNSIADINFNIDESLGFNLNIQLKKQQDIEYNSVPATFFFVSYVAFHFYNVFDAILGATSQNNNFSFDYNPQNKQYALAYTKYLF